MHFHSSSGITYVSGNSHNFERFRLKLGFQNLDLRLCGGVTEIVQDEPNRSMFCEFDCAAQRSVQGMRGKLKSYHPLPIPLEAPVMVITFPETRDMLLSL
jgi:hypothetical protein